METFGAPREFVNNSRYCQDRQAARAALDLASIDAPIVDIIAGFAVLPHCFTLQSCFGHFLCAPDQDLHSLEPIPPRHSGSVRYRIAYIAFCIENSRDGRVLRESLAKMAGIDPGYVQFLSADWFWERWANSYALQVEPTSWMKEDEAILDCQEALHTEQIRDRFFTQLRELLAGELGRHRAG